MASHIREFCTRVLRSGYNGGLTAVYGLWCDVRSRLNGYTCTYIVHISLSLFLCLCDVVYVNVCLHTGKTTISNDGATIMKLLDVVHPAAKTLVDISLSQDAEVGINREHKLN